MSVKNLWGEIPTADKVRAPSSILKEQAALLGEITQNVLQGKVDSRAKGDQFVHVLYIVAPALQNYAFALLHIRHTVAMYPLILKDIAGDRTMECSSEEAFTEALGAALSSQSTKRIVAALIAQSRAAGEEVPPL